MLPSPTVSSGELRLQLTRSREAGTREARASASGTFGPSVREMWQTAALGRLLVTAITDTERMYSCCKRWDSTRTDLASPGVGSFQRALVGSMQKELSITGISGVHEYISATR